MRIAYLINSYPEVSHSFIRREIEGVEAAGHLVDRYAIRGWDATLADPADEAERGRTRHLLARGPAPLLGTLARRAIRDPGRTWAAFRLSRRFATGGLRGRLLPVVQLAQAARLADWMAEARADHLHAHFGTNSAAVAALARALGGPPWSFTLHGQDEIERARSLAFRDKMKSAAFAVAVSSHGRAQFLREIDRADWDRVHVVHCGLGADFLAADPPPLPRAPRLLTIARLSEEKGHLILLPAFAALRRTHPEATLTLAGDGPMRAAIEARIAELGLGDAVTITGWVSSERVRAEIAAARLVVQPSFIEGLPVVLMEAMAMARPVISTFVGGVPELVTPARGWLVPAGDDAALTRAMTEALASGRLEDMGASGRAAVRTDHDARTEAGKLLALIGAGMPPPGERA